jgi:hypothetical protein
MTSTRTARIRDSKFRLGLKGDEGCGYHLVRVSAPRSSRFPLSETNLITWFARHVDGVMMFDRGKPQKLGDSLFSCHCGHNDSHMEFPGVELGAP